MDRITEMFLNHLQDLKVSKNTLKNYRSDLVHFKNWLVSRIELMGSTPNDLGESIPFLSSQIVSEYKDSLFKNSPIKTVNRRLATVRKLGSFLFDQNLTKTNFAKNLTNIPVFNPQSNEAAISQFIKFLQSEKVSQNTIKNYLSDIRQFDNWLINEENLKTFV